ncbi:MAG: TadE/TadG family type IV pilus assembly protein [Alphaproteobacteria bacterium]
MGSRRNRRGSSILEFAILGVPLLIMVFGFIELLLLYASSMMTASASEEISRLLYTGQFQKRTDNTEKDLKDLFCDQAVLLQCNENLLIDLRDFGGWDDVSLPRLIDSDGSYTVSSEPSDTEQVDISGERIVVMRVVYRWDLMTPGIAYFLRGAWLGKNYLFEARVFIVEPWDFLGT